MKPRSLLRLRRGPYKCGLFQPAFIAASQLLYPHRSRHISRKLHISDDSHDHLRRVFDSQRYFNFFNSENAFVFQNSGLFSGPKVGLFNNQELTTPHGLVAFSKSSLKVAKELVASMIDEAKSSKAGRIEYIKKLDQLSDILCRVIDVAEFVRVSHPSQRWVNAAQQTHEIMFEYMNVLNTTVELYEILLDILDDPQITRNLTEEEIQVGEYLKQDFERSGIAMDPQTRDNFVSITQQISLLGSQFNNEVQALDSLWCEVPRDLFNTIENKDLKAEILSFQSSAPSKHPSSVLIPLMGHIPSSLLLTCKSELVRKSVWIALHNSSKSQMSTLNDFVKYRALLAHMLGYRSFAHYQLEHKMAKTPENVITFLSNLQKGLISKKDGVVDEIKKLYDLKEDFDPNASAEDIISGVKPWDRDYLLSKLELSRTDVTESTENISEYLSVGTIISGLSQLFESIYNVKLVPVATLKGETWDQTQVRKLKVYDQSLEKTLGYLYLDFWSPKVLPSHFTIVCLRKLNTDIGTESPAVMRRMVHLDEKEKHQLPVIFLACNFLRPTDTTIGRFAGIENDKPTLLTLEQVDTIFHEMGHAMHSMIGRTDLHNLSGTRCLTDFVELPSVLMESFSRDPRVLCRIAKHYETDQPLSEEVLKQHQSRRVILDECETFMQSKMALLDQVLHSEDVVRFLAQDGDKDFDSTAVYHSLESKLKVFADMWLTWHGKFPHLFSYGAVYYSYLLDRAIAEKIWKGLFAEDPWSRSAGEKYRESVLKWGGTRDPWECLADALNNKELAKGDSRAMEIIGGNL